MVAVAVGSLQQSHDYHWLITRKSAKTPLLLIVVSELCFQQMIVASREKLLAVEVVVKGRW